ncbi:flagellar hook-associated protein FlgL [Oleiharenicola sp. Vm1]|uniref:flagellar hook-associated protein FlgL n=1 Tax=Oleiharenicola sp. Vm1 TaxID=3398393 RepID=UPI0039F57B17
MRIASSTVSDNIVRQIQNLGSQQARLQSQVATGQRITNPEDDPAAVSRVINLESERRSIEQFQRNAERALEVSQASYSGLQQIKKLSDRATEIGTLGAGAISPESLNAYASEINQLIEQAVQLGNTKFRNDYIYAGTAVDTAPFVATRDASGDVTAVAYAGNTTQSQVALSESSSVAPGTAGATNTGLGDFINHLVSLRDALRAGDASAVQSTQTNLLASEDVLVNALSEHGAVQMRIEVNQTQQKERADNLEKLVSAEADGDLPSAIVKLNQTQVAYQAALQSASNIMRLSLLDYLK